ncbi:MAG: YfhO family protein [Acidobacteriia bacterium]|nr:YfhO family protein [Terriglobia bacterium]
MLTLTVLHKLVTLGFITIGNVEDHLRLIYPYRVFDAEHLQSLSVPLWNPYTFSGFPYLASLRCRIFYPVNFILFLLPAHLAMNFSLVLHVFLAGLFMYLLAREMAMDKVSASACAVAFMFSGFFIDELWWGHETVLSSMCWTPLIFLFFLWGLRKRKIVYGLLGGFVFGVQLFAGHPQCPYYGLVSLFLFSIYLFIFYLIRGERQIAFCAIVTFIAIAVVGCALCAVQLVPAAELARYSVRGAVEQNYAAFTRWSMAPSYLVTFLLPRSSAVFGAGSFPFPVAIGYVGGFGLFMVAISFFMIRNRYVLFFWILTLFALVLAMGRYTPIYALFYRCFPGFDTFRNPILLLYVYSFAASVLVGFGVFHVRNQVWKLTERAIKRTKLLLLGVGTCCLGIAMAAGISSSSVIAVQARSPQYDLAVGDNSLGAAGTIVKYFEKYRDTLTHDVGLIGLMAVLAILPLSVRKRTVWRNYVLAIAMPLFIFGDLWIYAARFLKTYDLTPFTGKGKAVDFLSKEKLPFRVLPMLDYPEQDAVLKLNRISSINGYGSLEILKDYADFVAAFQNREPVQEFTILRFSNCSSVAVNLLNTKYILTATALQGPGFKLVCTDRIPAAKTWDPDRKDTVKVNLYENRSALPRAFVMHRAVVKSDRKSILQAMRDPAFNAEEVVFVEEQPQIKLENVSPAQDDSKVSFRTYLEEEIVLDLRLNRSGVLFLSEIYYPGWEAFVDGKETKIYRADYLFRSVFLEAGGHSVRFVYRPVSYRIGVIASLATLLFLPAAVVFHTVRNRNTAETPQGRNF